MLRLGGDPQLDSAWIRSAQRVALRLPAVAVARMGPKHRPPGGRGGFRLASSSHVYSYVLGESDFGRRTTPDLVYQNIGDACAQLTEAAQSVTEPRRGEAEPVQGVRVTT